MAEPDTGSAAEQLPHPIHEMWTTKEGWRRFVDQPDHALLVAQPELSTDIPGTEIAGYITIDDQDPAAAQYARAKEHSQTMVVNTPFVSRVTTVGRQKVFDNHGKLSARAGLIVTGAPGVGKTTALTQLGRAHELHVRQRFPHHGPLIPVMYMTVPPGANARQIAVEFARFLGLPLPNKFNLTDVVDAVCSVLKDARCELVLVDELHNMDLSTRNGAEASDQLKYFADHLPVTFIYAGIDLHKPGVFTGPRGLQILSRFSTLAASPFGYATPTQRAHWRSLIITMENTLRLRQHRPGNLPRLAQYLHDRTGGMIGSLSSLIRGAAVQSIFSQSEQVGRRELETVLLDTAAENHYTQTGRHRTARRRTSGAGRA